jgi:hypothetical protein
MALNNYDDFIRILLDAGFSMGGGNAEGVYSVVPFDWHNQPWDTPVRWHTGNRETDPWEWRVRVMEERTDIAYGKLFFKKSGYITREWYPYFLAVRRRGMGFAEEYREGTLSHTAKRVYETVSDCGDDGLTIPQIKRLCGFAKEDKSRAAAAVTELQARLYITVCGWKMNYSMGGSAGMSPARFVTSEKFWGDEVFDEADGIKPKEAEEAIREQIYSLNPAANAKKIYRFIAG